LQHGKRVNRLILAATTAGMLMIPGNPKALIKMADPRRYIDPAFMAKNFSTLYGGATDGKDGHISRITPPTKTGYFYQLLAMAGWTSAPFLPFLKHETLIMMGDDDQIVPLANGRFLNMLIPNAELVVIKGGGHLFLLSHTDESITAIRGFLDPKVEPARKAA
jgi:pimeloyl-ACP methyl ester carboxylesterase